MAALEVLSVVLIVVALGFAALGCRQDMNEIIIRPQHRPINRVNRSKNKEPSEVVHDKKIDDDTKEIVSPSCSPPSYKSVIG